MQDAAEIVATMFEHENGDDDINNNNIDDDDDDDDYLFFQRIRQEAQDCIDREPELQNLLRHTILCDSVKNFKDAVAAAVSYRLAPSNNHNSNSNSNIQNQNQNQNQYDFCPNAMKKILSTAMYDDTKLEHGHTMAAAVRADAMAILERDPAAQTLLEVVLFYKGFSALVTHRAARQKWFFTELLLSKDTSAAVAKTGSGIVPKHRSMTALFLQSQASAVFGLDIHPGATIGAGVFFDHGTGIVVGEAAWIGDGCTILHGVTLGGTGKETGDRHPKVGKNVLIGAGTSILGNIMVGSGSKIGAGSIVLKPIPPGATAVGAPAKIIGRVVGDNPAANLDESIFQNVELLHKSASLQTMNDSTTTAPTEATTTTTTTDSSSSSASSRPTLNTFQRHQSRRGRGFAAMNNNIDDNSSLSSSDDDGVGVISDDAAHVCPYREYRRMSCMAPKETITIVTLYKLLLKEGVPEDVVGCAFFALDTKNVGYVHCTVENCARLIKILKDEWPNKEWTPEEEKRFESIVEAYRMKHNKNCLLSAATN